MAEAKETKKAAEKAPEMTKEQAQKIVDAHAGIKYHEKPVVLEEAEKVVKG